MLVRRTLESLVKVMFFVITRKMLIKNDEVWELLVGVAALAGLFAIRKYLEGKPFTYLFHINRPTDKGAK